MSLKVGRLVIGIQGWRRGNIGVAGRCEMSVSVSGYRDFERKFRELKGLRDIFLFLLYDSGSGSEAIERFVRERFKFLDEHAGAAKTFIFLFTSGELGDAPVPNPGPAVAASFHILPNQLPGVLVFCLGADGESLGESAYLPLEESLFDEDAGAIEKVFRDLFSMIRETEQSAETPWGRIESLRDALEREKRARQRRPLVASLKAGTISAVKFAGELLIAVAPAWKS